MAHTHTSLKYHVVFGTAKRRASIEEGIAPRLHGYLGAIVQKLGGTAHAINGTSDHVHLLLRLPADLSISKAVQSLKANSSRWVREEFGRVDFGWQTGYGAFTVSDSAHSRVEAYIRNQAEHHRKYSFQDEFLALLKKHKIEYDPRFVLDE